MVSEKYMAEWGAICRAYCEKVNARLLFVNVSSFGAAFPDGTFRHIYADELVELLSRNAERDAKVPGGENDAVSE